VWASIGAGVSNLGLAGILSASLSRGPLVITFRGAGAENVSDYGDEISDRALLAGVRTSGNSRFARATIGIARARRSVDSDLPGVQRPARTGIAFEVKGMAAGEGSGLGLSLFGVVGPNQTSYVGTALTLNFGWFGLHDP
jgi:hypothetical protein